MAEYEDELYQVYVTNSVMDNSPSIANFPRKDCWMLACFSMWLLSECGCRRWQVYATEDVIDSSASIHCPRLEMASRSKLSCVCWNSYIKHLLLAADYDGCLSLWDAQGNICTSNFDDHGKRVWSADFSTVRTPVSTCHMSARSSRKRVAYPVH